ncbi:MAG: putative peptide maturation dehydrogenase [Rudaea sp.]
MRIRRCAILLIEPREKLEFSLQSVSSGGDGLVSRIELLALAPHLETEIGIGENEARVLNAVSPTQWVEFSDVAPHLGDEIVRGLLGKGLLIADHGAHADVRARDDALRSTHWQAHAAVTHYFGRWRGVMAGEDNASANLCSMAELLARLGDAPPAVHERAAPEARVALPGIEGTMFDDLLERRVTCRNFDASAAIDLETFSRMLRRVLGAKPHPIHADSIVLKRTSPSGGGLHPTEGYLLVQRVAGIAPGLYHYHPVEHSLEPLPLPKGIEAKAFARQMVAAQHYFMDAPVLMALVTRFPRSFWKYRNHSKAYRVTVLDAGHLSQTLYLSATDLGLGAFITAAINEADIEAAFGLDPLVESPIAVVGFGHRAVECVTFEFDPNRKVWPDGVEQPR